jgi:hypothetical protein
MDIFAHTLWANIAAKGANIVVEKKLARNSLHSNKDKKKIFRINVAWAGFWGVFPDLFAFTVPFIVVFFEIIFGNKSLSFFGNHHGAVAGFDIAGYLYQFSHSLVIFVLIFILAWVFSGRPRYELLGWALHIFIDIPSHTIDFFPTPFLFPISDYRFPYGVQWSNVWFMLINYSLLLIIWGGILFRKYFKIPLKINSKKMSKQITK